MLHSKSIQTTHQHFGHNHTTSPPQLPQHTRASRWRRRLCMRGEQGGWEERRRRAIPGFRHRATSSRISPTLITHITTATLVVEPSAIRRPTTPVPHHTLKYQDCRSEQCSFHHHISLPTQPPRRQLTAAAVATEVGRISDLLSPWSGRTN
jgi:hypothetical protein